VSSPSSCAAEFRRDLEAERRRRQRPSLQELARAAARKRNAPQTGPGHRRFSAFHRSLALRVGHLGCEQTRFGTHVDRRFDVIGDRADKRQAEEGKRPPSQSSEGARPRKCVALEAEPKNPTHGRLADAEDACRGV
jgi:hypothetical protein